VLRMGFIVLSALGLARVGLEVGVLAVRGLGFLSGGGGLA
jgi:hypothetical protein